MKKKLFILALLPILCACNGTTPENEVINQLKSEDTTFIHTEVDEKTTAYEGSRTISTVTETFSYCESTKEFQLEYILNEVDFYSNNITKEDVSVTWTWGNLQTADIYFEIDLISGEEDGIEGSYISNLTNIKYDTFPNFKKNDEDYDLDISFTPISGTYLEYSNPESERYIAPGEFKKSWEGALTILSVREALNDLVEMANSYCSTISNFELK